LFSTHLPEQFSLFVALNALRNLHSVGQPLSGLISEATFAAAVFTLLNYVRKHGGGLISSGQSLPVMAMSEIAIDSPTIA
jgi:hypothetical protein